MNKKNKFSKILRKLTLSTFSFQQLGKNLTNYSHRGTVAWILLFIELPLQSAILRILATGGPVTYAWDVAAPLILCALNFEVSIPADCNTDMIHLVIILLDTGLYGLMKDKNNLETKCPFWILSASQCEIYSFTAASGQIETQPEDEKVIPTDFPGLEVFNQSVTTKLIES